MPPLQNRSLLFNARLPPVETFQLGKRFFLLAAHQKGSERPLLENSSISGLFKFETPTFDLAAPDEANEICSMLSQAPPVGPETLSASLIERAVSSR